MNWLIPVVLGHAINCCDAVLSTHDIVVWKNTGLLLYAWYHNIFLISWAICKSALRPRQITMSAPHHSVFYRPDAFPAAQPTASKYWRCSEIKYVSQVSVDTIVILCTIADAGLLTYTAISQSSVTHYCYSCTVCIL